MLDRQTVRDQVTDLLLGANILEGDEVARRVHKSRNAPLSIKRLPALLVYTLQ